VHVVVAPAGGGSGRGGTQRTAGGEPAGSRTASCCATACSSTCGPAPGAPGAPGTPPGGPPEEQRAPRVADTWSQVSFSWSRMSTPRERTVEQSRTTTAARSKPTSTVLLPRSPQPRATRAPRKAPFDHLASRGERRQGPDPTGEPGRGPPPRRAPSRSPRRGPSPGDEQASVSDSSPDGWYPVR